MSITGAYVPNADQTRTWVCTIASVLTWFKALAILHATHYVFEIHFKHECLKEWNTNNIKGAYGSV